MKGMSQLDGTVTITFNIHQGERLEAPGFRNQYLPCEICGKVLVVGIETVAVWCDGCYPEGSEGIAPKEEE